ncbi:MAG: tetratricopeptide repeat protein [Bryobacterales bacterium]
MSFFVLALAAVCGAATLRSLVNEGNKQYHDEEYQEALKNYRLASEQSPDSYLAHFNLGAALYRIDEYTQAVTAFQQAAQMARDSGDKQGESLSRYNLGNAFFRSSEADARTNPREAVGALENAVESYQQALEVDPKLADAQHNIAMARRRMKELLDQMRNAPAGGQSSDEQEQLQKDIEENLERQKELSQQREDLEQQRQNPQNQQSQQDQEKQAQDLAQQQKELEQQSREMAKQLDKQQATPQEQKAKEQLEQAAQQQQSASQQLGQNQLDQAKGPQQQARQRLEDALSSLGGDPGKNGPQQPPQQAGSAPPPQDQQQRLQALEQSPQDILNEERSNRRRRRMLMLGQQTKVDKDW